MPNEKMGNRTVPQPPDVASGVVLAAVAGFLGFVALIMAVLFFYLKAGAPNAFRQAVEHPFPEPALQTYPLDDLRRFQFEQRATLAGYSWVDRSRSIARIPIDQAMRIIAARGDRAYDPPEPPANNPSTGDQQGIRP